MGESLREAVEAQALAHVRGDDAAFASYMTPQALLQIGSSNGHSRPRRYDVIVADEGDRVGESAVRYTGRGSYTLHQRWEQRDGIWKAVDAHRPPGDAKLPIWRRILTRRRHDGDVDKSTE